MILSPHSRSLTPKANNMINLQSLRGQSASSLRKSDLRSGAAILTACAGALAGLWSQQSHAVVSLTFDLRATSVFTNASGVAAVTNTKTVAANVGDIITFQLWATVIGTDNNQANDGITSGKGSFISSNLLLNGGAGTWLGFDGTANYSSTVNTDLDAAFRGLATSNGLLATTDSTNGGFELGRDNAASESAVPVPNPYFSWAGLSAGAPTLGSGAGNSAQFLLGTKTWRVDTAITSPITLQFAGRVTTALSKDVKWTVDGVTKSFNGNDVTNIAYLPAVVITAAVPEPSAFGMLALGALGLVGFRRLGLRRTA